MVQEDCLGKQLLQTFRHEDRVQELSMKDRLITICVSIAATYGLLQITPKNPKELELEVDRLIVRKELIVSDR
jgi:hypothetical protein